MKSPASMRASKRSCSFISSALRTAAGLLPPSSLPIVSIAWVYIRCSLLGTFVYDAAGFARQRAFDRIGCEHADARGDAHQRLHALRHPDRDLLLHLWIQALRAGLQLAMHLDLVEQPRAAHQNLILA